MDFTERLYANLPTGWFPALADAPNLAAILSMAGAAWSDSDALLTFTRAQTRIATATGDWLDFIAQDYFGDDLLRHQDENDTQFRRRLLINILAPRGTRPALVANVTNLVGTAPTIVEPRVPNDCGGYATVGALIWTGCAYSDYGHYGSMQLPFQLFIDVTRPLGQGIPNVSGYSMAGAGYGRPIRSFFPGVPGAIGNWGDGEYVSLSDVQGAVRDEDIYATVHKTMPAGTVAWTRIVTNISSLIHASGLLDSTFYLDLVTLSDDTVQLPGAWRGSLYVRFQTVSVAASVSVSGRAIAQFRVAASLNNPVFATARPTISFAILAALDVNRAAALTSVSFVAKSVMDSKVTLAGKSTLTFKPAVVMSQPVTINVKPSVVFRAAAVMNNRGGVATVTFGASASLMITSALLGVDFILGSSFLNSGSPALLDSTFVVGLSTLA